MNKLILAAFAVAFAFGMYFFWPRTPAPLMAPAATVAPLKPVKPLVTAPLPPVTPVVPEQKTAPADKPARVEAPPVRRDWYSGPGSQNFD